MQQNLNGEENLKKIGKNGNTSLTSMLRQIYQKEGIRALWSGAVPRTCWITIGGFVFFGGYES